MSSLVSMIDEARAAKDRALDVFYALAQVVGVGITRVGKGCGTGPTVTPALHPANIVGQPVSTYNGAIWAAAFSGELFDRQSVRPSDVPEATP